MYIYFGKGRNYAYFYSVYPATKGLYTLSLGWLVPGSADLTFVQGTEVEWPEQAGNWESWVPALAGDFGCVPSSFWEIRSLAPGPLM